MSFVIRKITRSSRPTQRCGSVIVAVAVVSATALVVTSGPAEAATPTVGLGTATSFAVLAGTTVTNTGPSVISGDLGVSPGTAVTGFPPGLVNNGVIHAADAVALQAQSDLTTAYNDAAGRTPPTLVSADLGGQTLAPGVYKASSALGLTGTVTLDAQSDPAAVFIFQAGSTLKTASNSSVNLIGGANPCNVFWQVGSSATIGTTTNFVGTILALTSITLQTGANITGRALARNGQVSLDTNTITRPLCSTAPPVTTTPPVTTAPSTTTSPAGPPVVVIPVPIPIPGLPNITVPRPRGLPSTPGLPTAPQTPPTVGTPPNSPPATNGTQSPRTTAPESPRGTTPQSNSPRGTTPQSNSPGGTTPQSNSPGGQIEQIPNGGVDTGDGSLRALVVQAG